VSENTADKKFQKELNAGTAALVLLSVLGNSDEPMYGYQIAKKIESDIQQIPMMKQGAFYPVLRSLETSGLLESRVEPSVTGPPRRYYRITDSGRQTLARWKELWSQTSHFVTVMMQGASDDK
jgi:PadR family transcriptional regulator PadR